MVGQVTRGGEVTTPEYFRLEHLQDEFNFVSDDELERSKRFRMLQLRNQGVAEFRNYKFIPAQEREVTDRMFQVGLFYITTTVRTRGPLQSNSCESLQKKCLQEYETRLKKGEIIDTKEYLDSHRALVAKYLQKVKKK